MTSRLKHSAIFKARPLPRYVRILYPIILVGELYQINTLQMDNKQINYQHKTEK